MGKLQVKHLKRYWSKSILKREGKLSADDLRDEWRTDNVLLSALGLGLEQTVCYVYRNAPHFDEFEDWILEVTGGLNAEKIANFNELLNGGDIDEPGNPDEPDALTGEDLDFWQQNGYVIVRNAVSREACDETIAVLCNYIGIDRYDAATWYTDHPGKQGIMVQLFQHPAIEQNRKAAKIRRAYEQLWNRKDIWVNADRVGFNAPETHSHRFQGPRLHWDASIKPPIPFGTQGILYLADTAENQGAFTLVPGFQNKIEAWLASLPAGANPRMQDLYALGPKPISANAGDFIIWHQALPHGSSPNTSALPRFVQYINYAPADEKETDVWL
jgi:hypothetical protein